MSTKTIVKDYPGVATGHRWARFSRQSLKYRRRRQDQIRSARRFLRQYPARVLPRRRDHPPLPLLPPQCIPQLARLGWIYLHDRRLSLFPLYLDATTIVNFIGMDLESRRLRLGLQLVYADRPRLRCVIALLQRKGWMPLHELTNVIQVFADVLSYLRLYALALAGMIMAETFNTTWASS